jgi:hypothetical protein
VGVWKPLRLRRQKQKPTSVESRRIKQYLTSASPLKRNGELTYGEIDFKRARPRGVVSSPHTERREGGGPGPRAREGGGWRARGGRPRDGRCRGRGAGRGVRLGPDGTVFPNIQVPGTCGRYKVRYAACCIDTFDNTKRIFTRDTYSVLSRLYSCCRTRLCGSSNLYCRLWLIVVCLCIMRLTCCHLLCYFSAT